MIMESTDIRPDFFLALYISSFHDRENILPSEIYQNDKSFGLVLIYYFFRHSLIVGIVEHRYICKKLRLYF